MNKRVITTSLALVLAMTVVLAVGKTDGSTELVTSQNTRATGITPIIKMDATVDILSSEINAPAARVNALIIPSEVDESELILEPESNLGYPSDVTPTSPLLESLARVQQALDRLEQLAANTELAVVALENQVATQ